MSQCMSKILISSLFFLIIFSGCSRKELSESQMEAAKDFIRTSWYDDKIRDWNNESVIDWIDFRVFDNNGKLSFDYSREYSASFGDKRYVSPHAPSGETHEDQIVDIYYDSDEEKLMYEFFEDNEDENPYTLYIKIDQDSIENKLRRQTSSRNKIKQFLDDRKFTQSINIGRSDRRGIFQNNKLKRRQNQDFSLDYWYSTETNNDYFDFDENDLITLKGFYNEGISWELKEIYNYEGEREVNSKDIKFKLTLAKANSIIKLMTENELSIYDTNIPRLVESLPENFKNNISFGKGANRFSSSDWRKSNSSYYNEEESFHLDARQHEYFISKNIESFSEDVLRGLDLPVYVKNRALTTLRKEGIKESFLRIQIKDRFMYLSSYIVGNLETEVEIETYEIAHIENDPSTILFLKPNTSQYIALKK